MNLGWAEGGKVDINSHKQTRENGSGGQGPLKPVNYLHLVSNDNEAQTVTTDSTDSEKSLSYCCCFFFSAALSCTRPTSTQVWLLLNRVRPSNFYRPLIRQLNLVAPLSMSSHFSEPRSLSLCSFRWLSVVPHSLSGTRTPHTK